ncbi:ornithine carbamoyltransferase [Saccharobesus litoralis]|uniref:Ornithine carbamoyltransferase n=1 Tax=Saccharobesus litoralis TaxID=2172099 RepID=A0A2S0VQK6_9ALTE|nr:ornithine carbamoyltransferase [Saccharobesus litoralis]AWB66484.1 ornithine carbamoyltransferase [Saccharobesus litoralis]
MENFLSTKDLSKEQILDLVKLAADHKQNPGKYSQALAGKSVATIYEKPSLRTRVSFDVGIAKMGGHSVYLDQQNGALGKRESVKDFALNLSCWVDCIVARVFSHNTLTELAEFASVPVVNSLCDLYHPCQAIADYQALYEARGNSLEGASLAYIGDGNNVTHSLMLAGAILGLKVVSVTPVGYSPDAQIVQLAQQLAAKNGGEIIISNDVAAAKGVDAIYNDTWISMGDSKSIDDIKQIFAPYQTTGKLMSDLGAKFFMHCQPVYRGIEVTDEVVDSEQSILMAQAENRMHAQNAVLMTLLK